MGRIFDALVKFFQEDDWKFHPIREKSMIHLGFSGDNGHWDCIAVAKEELGLAVFYSIAPVKASEKTRMGVAEFLTRANYGLLFGNFELDFSDGEIRFKTGVDVKDDRPSSGLIKPIIYANIALTDRYLPGIMAVCFGGVSPEEAVKKIESQPGP